VADLRSMHDGFCAGLFQMPALWKPDNIAHIRGLLIASGEVKIVSAIDRVLTPRFHTVHIVEAMTTGHSLIRTDGDRWGASGESRVAWQSISVPLIFGCSIIRCMN